MRAPLTVPDDALRAGLDARRSDEKPPAFRSEAQRDRDRLLYSSAFLRLGHVTQVAAPEVGHIFHSRLTHSLKVAQVARRLAERLEILRARGEIVAAAADVVDALDADAVEAAALAHDLGHPPFGHLAEEELQARSKAYGSFEGNAQSFRIVTRLALQSIDAPGLNLTRRTLNGLLKYPWLRHTDKKHWNKWGAYDEDREYFEWVREGLPEDQRTLEAQIMDWSDDTTYAVHDMDDFYRAGLIPLDRLSQAGEDFRSFVTYVGAKHPERAGELEQAAGRLFTGLIRVPSSYHGLVEERASLRKLGSWLITRFINAVQVQVSDGGADFVISDAERDEVTVLKELTWYYVIARPSLATIQRGQRGIINTLFEMYASAAKDPNEHRLFPPAFAERLQSADTEAAAGRVIVDLISGMTEASATEVYRRATGASHGPMLASASGPS